MKKNTHPSSSSCLGTWATSLVAHALLLLACAFIGAKLIERPTPLSAESPSLEDVSPRSSFEHVKQEQREERREARALSPEAATLEPRPRDADLDIYKEIKRLRDEELARREALLVNATPPSKSSTRIDRPELIEQPANLLRRKKAEEYTAKIPEESPRRSKVTGGTRQDRGKFHAASKTYLPEFPRSVRRRFRGLVIAEIRINEKGLIESVHLKAGTKSESLNRLIIETIERAKFSPARNGKRAVASTKILEIEFR